MKIAIDGERTRLEFYVDGRIFRRWCKHNWYKRIRRGEFSVSTPLFYLDIGADFWRISLDEIEQPKYSRSKRFSVTLEYGRVKGYKE